MAYDKSDPRAGLTPSAAALAPTPTGLIAEEQFAVFAENPQREPDGLCSSWFLRGCDFLTAYHEARPGALLERRGQIDEYALLLPDAESAAEISWEGESLSAKGPQVVFIPPGESAVVLPKGGRLVRFFTARSEDLLARCSNAGAYATRPAHIPPLKDWPQPLGGWRIRAYPLDVPDQPGRFGRIFRCTTFMLNVFAPALGPRDPAKLSPHHHEDFEQGSLALGGRYVHHLRWPWTTDMKDWRPDLAVEAPAPSLLVIPPPVIHTSRATDAGANDLVDVFCPPRLDFSLKEGWVLNAADYPLPSPAA